MFLSDLHLLNASSPIDVIEGGMMMVVSCWYSMKAVLPIDVNFAGSFIQQASVGYLFSSLLYERVLILLVSF